MKRRRAYGGKMSSLYMPVARCKAAMTGAGGDGNEPPSSSNAMAHVQ